MSKGTQDVIGGLFSLLFRQNFQLRLVFAVAASKPQLPSMIQRPGSSELISYFNRLDSGGLGDDANVPVSESHLSTVPNALARPRSSQTSSASPDASQRDIGSTTSGGATSEVHAWPLSPNHLSDPSQRDNQPSSSSTTAIASDGTNNLGVRADSSISPNAQATASGASASAASKAKAKMGPEELKA